MWKESPEVLERTFVFKDFTQAFAFMAQVAFQAEKQSHHPNWTNEYNKVTFKLTTHDADNKVTEKDKKLAASIDSVYAQFKV